MKQRPSPAPVAATHRDLPRHWVIAIWAVAMAALIVPLWSARDLPMVDLPQHLYALDVLARLHDSATAYSRWFEAGFRPTPYLGYYAFVHALDRVMPLEVANKIFVSFAIILLPIAVAALLAALKRPTWPALLAACCVYGDNFGWGFMNTMAGMPLALLTVAAFARALTSPARRARDWWATCLLTLITFGMHPVPLVVIAAGVPLVLLLLPVEPANGETRLSRSVFAVSAFLPALLLALAWVISLRGHGGSAPVSFVHEPFASLWGAFPWLLINLFQNGALQLGLWLTEALLVAAIVVRLVGRAPARLMGGGSALVLPALGALALLAYFTLPLSIQPHIQYMNPRFAPVAAVLLIASVPRLGPRGRSVFTLLAACVPVLVGFIAVGGFRAFDAEAAGLRRLAQRVPERASVMNLPFTKGSKVVHHDVFLHGAATIARIRGGIPSYCLAGWAQSPFRWKGAPIPSYRSEWEPGEFDFAKYRASYDAFLLRGAPPEKVFGAALENDVVLAAKDGEYSLYLRRDAAPSAPAPAPAPPARAAVPGR